MQAAAAVAPARSPGVWLVSGEVVQLRHIHQLDLAAGQGQPHMATADVSRPLYSDSAGCLCHAVALKHRTGKADTQKFQHLTADGAGTWAQEIRGVAAGLGAVNEGWVV